MYVYGMRVYGLHVCGMHVYGMHVYGMHVYGRGLRLAVIQMCVYMSRWGLAVVLCMHAHVSPHPP